MSERREGIDKGREQASTTQVWKEGRAGKFGKDSLEISHKSKPK